MQNTQSQQSIVRTDFTLKYYQIDELLAAHQKLKINGTNSNVFMRSWLEFSKSREDVVIPWSSGDIDDFLKVFSETVKHSVVSTSDLVDQLRLLQKDKPAVIVVDIHKVSAHELTQLLDALKGVDKSKTKEEAVANDAQNAATQTADFTEKKTLANIVLYCSKGEHLLSDYQGVLKFFAINLDVGGQALVEKKAHDRRLYPVLAAFLVIGFGAFFWQFSNDRDSGDLDFSDLDSVDLEKKAIVEANPGTASDADRNKQLAVNANPTKTTPTKTIAETLPVSEKLELGSESAVHKITGTDAEISSVKTVEAQQVLANSDETNTPQAQGKAQLAESIAIKVKEATTQKQIPGALVAAPEAKMTESTKPKVKSAETIDIVTVNSAQGINIGSSIKTLTEKDTVPSTNNTIEQQVDALVDDWISAWQAQKFDDYSRHYTATFSGKKNMSHQQWLDWRRKRIEKPEWIKLARSNIKHLGELEAGLLSITFTLSYASPNYKDSTFKKLILQQVDDAFKIKSEENLKVTRL